MGHTGVYDAAVEAITHTDAAVGTIYDACKEADYVLVITADHGNAEQMKNLETGEPHTAHTTNPVPLIITGEFELEKDLEEGEKKPEDEEREDGALCDIAPTILDIMGLDKPEGQES